MGVGKGHGRHASGMDHPRWNYGKAADSGHGYSRVRVGIDHPLADVNGYCYEHTLVWVAAGRTVPPGYLLHHKNEVPTDNRLENLELLTRAEHNALHNALRGRDELGRFRPKEVS